MWILYLILFFPLAHSQTQSQMVSLEELADRREKEEQAEKRNLFGSGTVQKVISKPATAKGTKPLESQPEAKSCEVVHFTGRKGVAVGKRSLEMAACQDYCIERKHAEKITHCFFDRQVIWKSNQ